MVTPDKPYPRPPIALIVTGQEWVSLSMVTLFSPRGYAVLRSYNGHHALERVRDAVPDLLIVDRDLRDMTGIEFCQALGEQSSMIGATTPVVLISTGPWDRESKLEALRAGAWEVCALPMDSEELFFKLDTRVRAKLAADVAREHGLLDPETGLYNSHGLLRRIAELSAGAIRYRRPLACVVLSAEARPALRPSDREVMRGYGVESATWTADSARSLAATLRAAGRASDAIGRLSPNEFVVLAPDTDSDGVLGLAERLRKAMQPATEPAEPGWHIRFGCYAVSNMREASIAPSEMLIRAAEALRGSEDGQEPVRFFTSPTDILN
ncbi:MAG TPA: response regulator [Longimicrobiales bacterium]